MIPIPFDDRNLAVTNEQAMSRPREEKGAFSGFGDALIGTVERPYDLASGYIVDKAGVLFDDAFGYWGGDKGQQWYRNWEQKKLHDSTRDYVTENELGAASAFVYQLGGMITSSIAGGMVGGVGGAMAAGGAFMGRERYLETKREGASEEAATWSGLGATALGAAGVGLPAYWGFRAIGQMASGAALNVGIGAIDRKLTASILENSGHSEIAKHYEALDGKSIAIDAVFGAAIPGMARVWGIRKPNRVEQDAALIAKEDLHNDVSLPTLPRTNEELNRMRAEQDRIRNELFVDNKPFHEIQTQDIPQGPINPRMHEEMREIKSVVDGFEKTDPVKSNINEMVSTMKPEHFETRIEGIEARAEQIAEAGKKQGLADGDEVMAQRAKNVIEEHGEVGIRIDNKDMKIKDLTQMIENQRVETEQEIKLRSVAIACAMRMGE